MKKIILLSIAMLCALINTLSYILPSVKHAPEQGLWSSTIANIARNIKHAWNRASYSLGYQNKEEYLENKVNIQKKYTVTNEDRSRGKEYQNELETHQQEQVRKAEMRNRMDHYDSSSDPYHQNLLNATDETNKGLSQSKRLQNMSENEFGWTKKETAKLYGESKPEDDFTWDKEESDEFYRTNKEAPSTKPEEPSEVEWKDIEDTTGESKDLGELEDINQTARSTGIEAAEESSAEEGDLGLGQLFKDGEDI